MNATATDAIHTQHPKESALCDVNVALRHGAAVPSNVESTGTVLLGPRPPEPGW